MKTSFTEKSTSLFFSPKESTSNRKFLSVLFCLSLTLSLVVGEGNVLGQVITLNTTSSTLGGGASYTTTESTFTTGGYTYKLNNWIGNSTNIQARGNQTTTTSNFYIFNTTVIPGNITSINVIGSNLINSKINLIVGSSAVTSSSGGIAGGSSTIAGTSASWTVTGSNTYFRIQFTNGATSGTGTISSITINYAVTPTITGTATATAFTTTYGTASSAQNFSVSGSNLTSSLVATAPTGFEVSADGTTYGSTATFTTTGGSASGSLRLRLKANATVSGTYNSQNIVLSSTGATSVNITTAASGNTVSAKALTITGLLAANKNYDGSTTVSVTGTAAYSGLVNSESFSPSDVVTWAFPDANVGTNKILTRTGTYTAPSSNYTVTQPSLTASISAIVPSAPSITGITAGNAQLSIAFNSPSSNGGASITNYEYSLDGGSNWTTPSPAVSGTPLLITGLTNGTTYTVQIRAVNSAGSGSASGSSLGTPVAPANPTITVTPSVFASVFSTTYGTASSVQSFTVAGAALTGDLTLSAPSGFEISFSNSTGFTSSLSFTSTSGSVPSTNVYVRLSATTAASTFNNVSFSVTGGGATATSITTTASNNLVAQKALTISGVSASNKSYDGTIAATLNGTASYVGLANGESYSVIGTPTATFASSNVANGISVSVTGYSAPSANYSLTQPSLAANITPVNLNIVGISVSNKVYNGTTTATITGTAAYQGLVNGESYTVTGTPSAVFASANAGSAIAVTVSGYTAPSANYTITQPSGFTADITKADQTITFAALANKTTADVPFALTGTVSSGLALTYTSSNTAVATISGSTVTIVGAGTTTITASQAGNGNYNVAADVSRTLSVTVAPVSIFANTITGTNPNTANPYTTGQTNNSNITVSGISRGAGIAGTNANDRYTANTWNSASLNPTGYFEFTLTPNVGYQINFSSFVYTSQASGTGPTNFAIKSSLDNYSANIGSPVVAGTTINLSSNAYQNIVSSITFRFYAWGASASAGTFSINDFIFNGVVSLLAAPPTLTPDATSNTVDNNIDITYTDDASWRNAISAVKVNGTALIPSIDYDITTAGNIQLKPSGGNALLTTAGTKTVTVVASGYTDATVTQAISAGAPTSNSSATISTILAAGATRTITCTAKDQYNNLVSGYFFKYDATVVANNATTNEVYVIDGATTSSTSNDVSLTTATNASGVATFTVVMPSTLDEADGLNIQVQLANGTTNVGTPFAYHELPSQTISFAALSAKTYGDASFNLTASGGASGNPVVYTSSNTSVATCTGTNGSTVTIVGAGSATIYANQAGNSSYNAAAQVSQVLVVNQRGLTISGVGAADKIYNGSSAATITGTPVYVGLVNGESFAVSGTGVATFSDADAGIGKTVSFIGYTAPSANYTLTQPTATATISQASQSISFGSLPNRFVGGPAFTLTQNASSGLAITYSSSNTSVATIVGNTVTLVGAGTTTITATQAGNNNYSAAISVSQTLRVIETPIAGWDFFGQTSPATFAATTFNSNLDGSSALSNITRGPGAQANSAANSFSTTGFQNNGISVSNTDYFQVTLKAKSGYSLSLSEINANFDGTTGYYTTPGVTSQYAYSTDGANFTLIGSPITSTSLKPEPVSLLGIADLQSVTSSTTVTIRYYASGQTTTGGWRFSSPSAGVLGLAIGGSLCQLPQQLSLSSTSFCNNGETSIITSTTSSVGVTYELYDGNGVVPNSSKPGTGAALAWSGLLEGTYYVIGTRDAGGCATTSASITLTPTAASYAYYIDSDGDGFGSGSQVPSCSATTPTGYSSLNTDCNDNNASISPGIAEICGDGIDNNCDNNEAYPSQYRSAITDGDWSNASTWEKYCNQVGSWTAASIAPSNQYFNTSAPFAITIQSGHTVTVSTTSTTNFAKAGSLTVAGNLVVNGNLTVTSSVINNGNVTINHGASFVQTSEVDGNNNTGSGNFVVKMNLTGVSNGTAPTGRYWYLGSPMNNTVASLFFDQPNMVRLWIYEPTNNSWVTLINSSTTASGATNSTQLIPGMGYLYRAGFDKTITFTGDATKFNNNITTPLSFTGAGYKYVSNPYTSHVDWRLVTRTGLNVSYWIRNANNTSYEAYNATSGVSTPTGTQTTQYIPPMQGFWVYAYTTSSSLRIDNGDRTHSTNALHAPEHNQIVRLNLNDGKTDDQAVVYENENASNGIEEYDTDKFMDENHHQVYFLEGTKQVALDGLKDATAKQKVDMGIQITSAGTYTINAVELGVEEDVVLEDKFTHTFQDMKRNSTYSFTSNAGTYNNRFVLHFTLNPQTETAIETETVAVTETEGETDGVNVYTTTGQQVKVWVTNTAEFQNATVKVYDAIGNLVERKNMTSNELLLDLNTATGVYLVEVTGVEKVFTKKVFIGK